jgi:hypothetical protein
MLQGWDLYQRLDGTRPFLTSGICKGIQKVGYTGTFWIQSASIWHAMEEMVFWSATRMDRGYCRSRRLIKT